MTNAKDLKIGFVITHIDESCYNRSVCVEVVTHVGMEGIVLMRFKGMKNELERYLKFKDVDNMINKPFTSVYDSSDIPEDLFESVGN